jgi:hypothetical protein
MPHHQERAPSALAHGPAKTDDIERARRDVTAAEPRQVRDVQAGRALDEMEAACETIREDVSELKRVITT